MPGSRNKYSRAAIRARYRKPRRGRSSGWFYGTLALVVVLLGGILVATVLENRGAEADVPPRAANQAAGIAGDHWHAVIGVNICGQWISDPATFETRADNPAVAAGIHTHGDGFIHIHPYTRSEAGEHATLGRFFEYGGWRLSSDAFEVWSGPASEPSKRAWANGDRCPGTNGEPGPKGRLVWSINCKVQHGDPADHKLRDQEVIAIGFLPKGEQLGAPPHATSAPADDGSSPGPIDQAGCKPSSANNPGVAPTSPTAATTATTAPATTP